MAAAPERGGRGTRGGSRGATRHSRVTSRKAEAMNGRKSPVASVGADDHGTADDEIEHVDVAVVRAGQAGLAIGYWVARHDRRFVILERAAEIAAAWRERWDSLTLFTPRRYSALPGLAFPGDPDGYPTRDEVIAYLERYADTFELPVALNSDVQKLEARDGSFSLELGDRPISA